MNQKEIDLQDQKLEDMEKSLKKGLITPDEAFDALQMMGFGRIKALEKTNKLCEKTDFRSDFIIEELED